MKEAQSVYELFEEADTDKSGTISKEEFCVFGSNIDVSSDEEALELFDRIDTDHNGAEPRQRFALVVVVFTLKNVPISRIYPVPQPVRTYPALRAADSRGHKPTTEGCMCRKNKMGPNGYQSDKKRFTHHLHVAFLPPTSTRS